MFDLAPPPMPRGPEVIPPVAPRPPQPASPPEQDRLADPDPVPLPEEVWLAPAEPAPQDLAPVMPPARQPRETQAAPVAAPVVDTGLPLPEALDSSMLAHALAAGIPPLPEAPFIAVEAEDFDPEPMLAAPPLQAPPPATGGPKLAVTSVINHRRTPPAPLTPPATAASAPTSRSYAPPDEPDAAADLAAPLRTEAPAAPLAAPARPGKAAKAAAAPGLPGKAAAKAAKPGRAGTPAAAASTLVAPLPPGDVAAKPLRGRPRPTRGKPRYLGLILTGLLLLALAAIGAWSSIALSRLNQPDTTETASVADETLLDEASHDAPLPEDADLQPSPDDEAAADGETLAEADPAGDADTPPAAVAGATTPSPATADLGPSPVQLAGDQDEIILSTMDSAPRPTDALSLPPTQAQADALPVPAVPPPPFGTQYAFGPNGLILPTPEGIVTPEGLRLVAGPPPKVPPPRPASIAALAAAAAVPSPDADPAQSVAPAADPRLQGFRPRPRPEGLVAPTADDAALAIPPERRMSSLRPRARPAAITRRAEQIARDEAARSAAAAASLSATAAAQAGAEAVPQGEDATAEQIAAAAAIAPRAGPISPQAVAISRKPPKKPRDFDRRVRASVAAAAAARPSAEPQPEEPVERSASRSAEPGEDEEPTAPAARAPKVPTKASVAKNATFVNAINLGKTNLIGVYGTPSKRYALIRLGSGQYKKVRVGDRVDGGTVAAITENEVRYKKGGRMVSLGMPRG